MLDTVLSGLSEVQNLSTITNVRVNNNKCPNGLELCMALAAAKN
jgi:hypothetical protein